MLYYAYGQENKDLQNLKFKFGVYQGKQGNRFISA